MVQLSWVQYLVRELKSHKPHGMAQNKTKQNKKTSHISMGMLGSDKTILFVHKIHTCT